MSKKPTITLRRDAGIGEALAEITWPDGRGCMLSARTLDDGTPVLDAYRADPGIVVMGGSSPAQVFDCGAESRDDDDDDDGCLMWQRSHRGGGTMALLCEYPYSQGFILYAQHTTEPRVPHDDDPATVGLYHVDPDANEGAPVAEADFTTWREAQAALNPLHTVAEFRALLSATGTKS